MTKAASGIARSYRRRSQTPATASLSRVQNDLAQARDGISERFVPEQDRGRLIEAEHLARYRWAAQAADGQRVLDAGCGTAYGSRLLAEAGAREVVGVDVAQAVVETVALSMPETVHLVTGDLRELTFTDGEFDLVVCFEVIEHVEDPAVVLDELVRVLAPDGLLLISSPNRGVYPPGNPHHVHELTPAELEAELTSRLDNVRLLRQDDHIVSALHERDGDPAGLRLDDVTADRDLGSEVYTVAVASRSTLPDLPGVAVLTGTLELREWLAAADVQTAAIADKDNFIVELEARLQERDRLSELLVDAEQRLAKVPELNLRIADLEHELGAARGAEQAARREAQELDQMLMYGRRMLRHVRPLIKPLRKARRRLRS
jgi:SAM-dependent methyltransferase